MADFDRCDRCRSEAAKQLPPKLSKISKISIFLQSEYRTYHLKSLNTQTEVSAKDKENKYFFHRIFYWNISPNFFYGEEALNSTVEVFCASDSVSWVWLFVTEKFESVRCDLWTPLYIRSHWCRDIPALVPRDFNAKMFKPSHNVNPKQQRIS